MTHFTFSCGMKIVMRTQLLLIIQVLDLTFPDFMVLDTIIDALLYGSRIIIHFVCDKDSHNITQVVILFKNE